jgi:hypothetical protein
MFMDEQQLDKFVDEIEMIFMSELKLRSGLRSAVTLMEAPEKIDFLRVLRGRVKEKTINTFGQPAAAEKPEGEGETNRANQPTEIGRRKRG